MHVRRLGFGIAAVLALLAGLPAAARAQSAITANDALQSDNSKDASPGSALPVRHAGEVVGFREDGSSTA